MKTAPTAHDEVPSESYQVRTVVLGSLSLGLVFSWMTFIWNNDSTIFGIPTISTSVHYIWIQLSIGISFLLLSLSRNAFNRMTFNIQTALAAVLACAAVILHYLNQAVSLSSLVILTSCLSGLAFALLVRSWLFRYRLAFVPMLMTLAIASGIGYFLHLVLMFFGNSAGVVASVALPLVASLSLLKSADVQSLYRPVASRDDRAPIYTAVAIVLGTFAAHLVAYNQWTDSGTLFYITSFVSFGLATLLAILKCPREEVVFSLLIVYTSICVAAVLIFAGGLPILTDLLFIGSWSLSLYAIAWFSQQDVLMSAHPLQLSLRGLAAVYLAVAMANTLGPSISTAAACGLAFVLATSALAIVFINASRTDTERRQEVRSFHDTSAALAAIERIARRGQLTEKEKDVFLYLEEGHTLKKITKMLGITENTAKYHRHNVYQKLGISSRQELIDLVEEEKRATRSPGVL